MNRLVMVSGTVLAFAFAIATQEACSSSDSSGGSTSSNGGSGNASSNGGTGNVGTGGTGTAGASTGTAGSTTDGGAQAGGAPAGGAPSGGMAGTAGAGTAGSAGAGTAGSAGGGTMPGAVCGSDVKKGGACTASCAKGCGVKGPGATKAETCTGGTYMEGACTYPTGADLSCYKKPATPATCDGAHPNATNAALMVVTANTACAVADCMPCGPYEDSSAVAKDGGLCVCTGAAGMAKWNCASATEWPVVP